MSSPESSVNYVYTHARHAHTHAYLMPSLRRFLDREKPRRIFEVGCGNGSIASWMHSTGAEVIGIDPSASGIALARQNFPGIRFESDSTSDDLSAKFGTFAVVVSLEVVEHVYDPRRFAKAIYELLEPGGAALITTPYHGYLKNLALALSGKMDSHFTALWDGGHIKFWSISTLGTLLSEAGFVDIEFERVGRIPSLAKSMVSTFRKPKA